MLFESSAGDRVLASPCPQRAPRLTNTHCRRRRNALWLHAWSHGLFDPGQDRVRPYTVNELAALWGVTPKAVRYGINEATKDRARVRTHANG